MRARVRGALRRGRHLAAAALVRGGIVGGIVGAAPEARADLPPPPGLARVSYAFTVRGEIPASHRLVAYPFYLAGSSTPELTPGQEVPLHQGYQPGLWAVPAAKVGDIPRDHREAVAWLEQNAKRCLEKVPRIFTVRAESEIARVKDELRIEEMGGAACRIVPVSATYELTSTKTLTGSFQAGARVLPAGLEGALDTEERAQRSAEEGGPPGPAPSPPSEGSAGSPDATPSAGPRAAARPGCGCELPARAPGRDAWAGALAGLVALGAWWRRRRA